MITPRTDLSAEFLAEQGLSPTFTRRFWSRVFITPTHWLWEGARKASGHGIIWKGVRNAKGTYQGKIGTHVASWILHFGPVPEGKWVLHNCPESHIAWCVNPEHLKLGDAQENQRDMIEQGRCFFRNNPGLFHGPNNGGSKFSYEQIDEIRAKYATGEYTQAQLGAEYGVTQACISLIVLHKNWTKMDAGPKHPRVHCSND